MLPSRPRPARLCDPASKPGPWRPLTPETGVQGSGEPRCIAFGGLRVVDAIEAELLRVIRPGAIAAAIAAEADAAARRDPYETTAPPAGAVATSAVDAEAT